MTMTPEQERAVRDFLRSRFRGYCEELGLDESLDSIVDSIGQFELVGFLENTFAFRIPNEDFHPDRFSALARIGEVIARYSGNGR
jgi:acyl carrier protein